MSIYDKESYSDIGSESIALDQTPSIELEERYEHYGIHVLYTNVRDEELFYDEEVGIAPEVSGDLSGVNETLEE